MKIAGHGQIAQMELPSGWQEIPDRTSAGALVGARSLREFVCPNSPDTRICFYYRGGPISLETAGRFVELLNQPDHELTEGEYLGLEEVLESANYPGAFTKHSAKTIDINGRRVLAVEGFWNASGKLSVLLMIDADGTGRFVQEIGYDAPQSRFPDYIEAVRESFNSIKWV